MSAETPDANAPAPDAPAPAPAAPPAPAPSARPPRPTKQERREKRWAETKMDLKWATALLFVLILGVSGWLWSSWDAAPDDGEDLPAITRTIFNTEGLVVPFEILSLLLLAALIAGVVIAFREHEGGT